MLFVLMDYLERGIILERENQLTYRRKSWNRNFDYSFLNSRRTSATIPIQSVKRIGKKIFHREQLVVDLNMIHDICNTCTPRYSKSDLHHAQ